MHHENSHSVEHQTNRGSEAAGKFQAWGMTLSEHHDMDNLHDDDLSHGRLYPECKPSRQ